MKESHEEAENWYRLAAEQRVVEAQYFLGLMYLLGQGVVEDHRQAYAWLDIAEVQGNRKAQELKYTVIEHMNFFQIMSAKILARQFYRSYVERPFGGANIRK